MMKFVGKYALLALVAALLYLGLSGNLFSHSPLVIASQVAALALSAWSRKSFADGQFRIGAAPAEGKLIRSGPYRFIRHPMYAAALLLIWSSVLGHVSLVTVLIGVLVTAVILVRILVEEQRLRASYPEYAAYSQETRYIIPYLL